MINSCKSKSQLGIILQWILVIALYFFSTTSQGKIINVPSDYSQISNAVDNANNGDEIVVAPGKYKGFSFAGINLIIRSTFNGDWSAVKNTIIVGGVGLNDINHIQDTKCVLRGFSLQSGGIVGGPYIGTNSHATIEYNIISGITNLSSGSWGAGIINCDGLIQNNIIENNASHYGTALLNCHGTIQNNIIRNNRVEPWIEPTTHKLVNGWGGAMTNCSTIRNNTIVDNFQQYVEYKGDGTIKDIYWRCGGLANCSGIVNNIIYNTTMTMPLELDNSTSPTYCLFRTPHSGAGNITGDPKFVNPAHGDFHLKPDSPAIDAGKAQPDLRSDPDGHQRGLKGATGAAKGDGSNNDIGAFEALPRPVAIWLAGGGPSAIYGGAPLAVAWEMAPPAGTDVHIYLLSNGANVADLGRFGSASGAGTGNVILPNVSSSAGAEFSLLAASVPGGVYHSTTPRFRITTRNAVAARDWLGY